jgi:hypothetical protein
MTSESVPASRYCRAGSLFHGGTLAPRSQIIGTLAHAEVRQQPTPPALQRLAVLHIKTEKGFTCGFRQ